MKSEVFNISVNTAAAEAYLDSHQLSEIVIRTCIFLTTGADVRRQFSIEEEDDLLQFAIQQSLIEAGSERDEVSIYF